MNNRGGWALIRATWLSWMVHRSFFFLLAFGWMIPPLIYLFVWSTAAGGETIEGFSRGEFVSYYLILILVNQLTYAQTNWTVGDMIRDGSMSRLLLYPMSPLYNTLSTELAGKVVYMIFIIPITVVLACFLKPEINTDLINILAFIPALIMAWMLRFFWGYWLALLSFWMTRAQALLALQDGLIFLFAGQVAPTALLPDGLREAAIILPFRYMVSFPVELIAGHLSSGEIISGFIFQFVWLFIAILLYQTLWRRGVKKYVAIGG